ncbi:MAG: hypothetical protein LBB34_02580 [Holosporales bacterium]|jgi:hypothetical protein|nr:hypothetical protein [Holosporales bacterium]
MSERDKNKVTKNTGKHIGQPLDIEQKIDEENGFFGKNVITNCVLSAILSVITAFTIMKIGMNYHDHEIQEMRTNLLSAENKIKIIDDTLSSVIDNIEQFKTELKGGKENLSYIYNTLSSLQHDVSIIKNDLHIDTSITEDAIDKLPSDKQSFLTSLENLVTNGAQFAGLLESYSDKIDIKQYAGGDALGKLADQNTESIGNLRKRFVEVGRTVFETNVLESLSFWERQKRIIREKIMEAIKIRKHDKNIDAASENLSDKVLFDRASILIGDGKIDESIEELEKIGLMSDDLSSLISDLKKRSKLDEVFVEFKKAFIEAESKSPRTVLMQTQKSDE